MSEENTSNVPNAEENSLPVTEVPVSDGPTIEKGTDSSTSPAESIATDDPPVMAAEEKPKQDSTPANNTSEKTGTNAATGLVQGIVETLKTNPKARYAAIGGIVAILLVSLMGGGEESKKAPLIATGVGQQVTLENPNGGNSHLTAVPGLLSASDAEEDKEQSICLTPAGTRAKVEEEQVVGQLPFVKVKVLDGECQGKTGWTSKVNVKAG